MKILNLLIFVFFNLFTYSSFSGDFVIPHIAEKSWNTKITIINPTPFNQDFSLTKYNESGEIELQFTKTCNSKDKLILSNEDFGYYGIVKINTAFDKKIFVKLSYQFGDSQSLSEFFISENSKNTQWLIPNPHFNQFSWFGIALASESPQNFQFIAYKDGVEVGNKAIVLDSFTKFVNLSSGIWEGLNYENVDMVLIKSDTSFSPPLSITGNEDQSRHLFFSGIKPFSESKTTYSVPHIAENSWSTSLDLYNGESSEQQIILNTYESSGNDSMINQSVSIASNSINSLQASESAMFPFSGSGSIESDRIGSFSLTYKYGNSDSICSFFLNSTTGSKWLIPNSIHSWFNWFGIALNNPYNFEISYTIEAYKDGELLTDTKINVPVHGKFVDLSNNIFSGDNQLTYSDIDMLILYSDYITYAPISITGNDSQDRHVFFNGQCLVPGNQIYFVDQNNKTGNSDGSLKYPFSNINEAISTANSNDIIKISANIYNENIEINNKKLFIEGGFQGGSESDYQNEIKGEFTKPIENSYSEISGTNITLPVIKLINSLTSGSVLNNLKILNGKHGITFDNDETWPLLNNVEITNCQLLNNGDSSTDESYYGGGIAISGNNILINGCLIKENQAGRGAGIGGTVDQLYFTNNLVESNTANSDHGGGIFIDGNNNQIINNTFKDNKVGISLGYGWGGGIFASGTISLKWNKTIGNQAYSKGGGVFLDEGCVGTLEHEIIVKNTTLEEWNAGGAGIYIDGTGDNVGSNATITSSTIAYNSSPGTLGGNGIFIERGSTANVENSIFYGNGDDFYFDETSSLTVNFSLSEEHILGMGNTSGDPLFYDYENNDYHLKSIAGRYDQISKVYINDTISSHCIDRGNLSSDFSNEVSENGKRINIGAYGNSSESSKTPVKSDEDNMIDNAFRIDIQNIDVTFDIDTTTDSVYGNAKMTFYMRHGYEKPVFHFRPLTSGWSVDDVKLNGEILDVSSNNDLKIVTFDGSTQKAVEIQRNLEENTLYTLEISYPLNYAMDFYKKIWTWNNVNDIEGVGNEYYFPTINFPSELAKHKITFNVHGGGYSFISSGKTSYNTIDDGQQFIIEPGRDVASYTIMFVLIPADDVVASKKTINGVNVKVMAYKGGASITSAFNYLESWLPKLENDLGEFPMPEGLNVFLTSSGGGMEFYGATITSLSALNHEVFHMYYGTSTINKTYRDSWLDEAINEWYELHSIPISSSYTSNIVSGRTSIGVGFDTRAYRQGANIIGAVAEELGGVNEMVGFLKYLHNNYFFRPYTTLEFIDLIKLYGNVDMYDNFIQWVYNNEPQAKSKINQGVDEKHKVDMTPPEKIRQKYLKQH